MQPLGRILVVAGLALAVVGVLLMFSDKVPFLGRLPGDISIKRENFRLYIPITTSILFSLLVSAILWLFSQFKGK